MKQRYLGQQQGESFQETICAEAADEKTSAARLQELSKEGGSIAIEVARNPGASRETMLALAASDDALVQCALVQNPGVTKDVLLALLKANPTRPVKRAIANYSHNREVIGALEKTAPGIKTRRALAANRGATYETLLRVYRRWPSIAASARQEWTELFLQGDEEVREQCLWRVKTNIDPWLTASLSNVAINSKTSPEILRTLSTISLRNITQSLSMNPSTPKDVLEGWATEKTFEFSWALAANPSMSPEALAALSSKANLRVMLAANPSTPAAQLASYADSNDIYLLTPLAKNPSTPPEILESLANRKKPPYLSRYLASNSSLSSRALLTVATQKNLEQGTRAMLEKHPNITAEVRYVLLFDEQRAFVAAKNPETPAQTLLLLAQDNRFKGTPVFAALLSNPNTPAEILGRVIQQRRITTDERLNIARNPNATAEMLGILATLPGKNLRELITQTPPARH